MRIYLLNLNPRHDADHWRNEHTLLTRLAARSRRHELTSDPQAADLILLCGILDNALFPKEIWSHPLYRAYRVKCARLGTEDNVTAWVPGLYASLPRRFAGAGVRGGPYPHVALAAHLPDQPPLGVGRRPPFLYSFQGAFETHPLRLRIGRLNDERALIEDTTSHPGRQYGQSAEIYAAYRERYARILCESLFILCPRGSGASSIRLFEALKVGRVPVIISDDWIPPSGPAWDSCSLRVREADVGRLPEILRAAEPRYHSLAQSAADVWRRFFAADTLFDYLAGESCACLAECGRSCLWRLRIRQMLTWRFLRRGLLPGVVRAIPLLKHARRGGLRRRRRPGSNHPRCQNSPSAS